MHLHQTSLERPSVVLVVEPHADTRAMMCAWLSLNGFRTIAADTNPGGVAMAARLAPDVVLVTGEREDGPEVAVVSALRASTLAPATPIVFITANGDPLVRRKSRVAGATACVEKPVDLDSLLGLVGRLVEPARATRRRSTHTAGAAADAMNRVLRTSGPSHALRHTHGSSRTAD